MHDAMSHKFEEGRWMCEVVSVWPQARKVERPNNSGVRVKGMNLSSTHLGVGGLATSSVDPLRWGSWSVRSGWCNEG
jgi:hypothetical protein